MRPVILIALLVPSLALAHAGAMGVVKERMDLMKDVGAQAKTLGEMAKSGVIDPPAAKAAAAALAQAARDTPGVFEVRNLDKPSESLPALWDEWDRFVQMSEDMALASDRLAEQTGDLSAFRASFGEVARSCTSCHEAFRQP